MLRPIDVSILDAKHLTLPAARFQPTDDAIVHRRSCPFVFGTIHRQIRFKQRLLFVAMNSTIPPAGERLTVEILFREVQFARFV